MSQNVLLAPHLTFVVSLSCQPKVCVVRSGAVSVVPPRHLYPAVLTSPRGRSSGQRKTDTLNTGLEKQGKDFHGERTIP